MNLHDLTIFFSKSGVNQQNENNRFPDKATTKEEFFDFLKNRDSIFSVFEHPEHGPNNISKGAIFKSSNCLFIDIDNGSTIADVRETLKDYKYIIYTSRNHKKEKNGITCERFHVIFPIDEMITDDKRYRHLIIRLIDYFKGDPACKNINRKFYGPGDIPNYEYFSQSTGKDILVLLPKEEKKKTRNVEPGETEYTNDKQEIPIDYRHNTLLGTAWKLACTKTLTKNECLKAIQEMNTNRAAGGGKSEKEIIDIVDWVYEKMSLKNKHHLTEKGTVELFVKIFGENFKWSEEANKWYFFNGQFWEVDYSLELERHVKMAVDYLYNEAINTVGKTEKTAALKWAIACEQKKNIKNIIELAKAELSILQEQFDSYKNLFNVKNGTIDLNVLPIVLMPHDKRHLITKMAPIDYKAEEQCPMWNLTQDLIYDNIDKKEYMQRALSLCLSGHNSQYFHFMLGEAGANGKSTTLNLFSLMLGNYCQHIPTEMLMLKRNDNETGVYIVKLKGARLIIALETNPSDRLNATFIKSLTGGDKISGRGKYAKDSISFNPEGKLFIAGNNAPRIDDTTDAMWRRVRYVEYNKIIPEAVRKDEYWKVLYDAEASGIFNWLLEGWANFKAKGIIAPACVLREIEGYKEQEDTLQAFITERCDNTGDTLSSTLHRAFSKYCKDIGDYYNGKMSIHRFSKALVRKGYQKDINRSGSLFKKINLKNQDCFDAEM
jgi:P4 family phage/plasmid primase-like protien